MPGLRELVFIYQWKQKDCFLYLLTFLKAHIKQDVICLTVSTVCLLALEALSAYSGWTKSLSLCCFFLFFYFLFKINIYPGAAPVAQDLRITSYSPCPAVLSQRLHDNDRNVHIMFILLTRKVRQTKTKREKVKMLVPSSVEACGESLLQNK